MRDMNFKKIISNYLLLLIGSVLLAFAVSSILKPSGLIMGGATGISILLERLINIKYTYIYYAVTIAVLIITLVTLGKNEVIKILMFSLIFPPILIFFDSLHIHFIKNDMLLSAVYFGVLAGIGSGLVLKVGFSQGATDTLAKIIHLKCIPFVGISQIFIAIDIILIAASAFVFDVNTALYGVITEVVMMKSIDAVLIIFSPKKVKVEILSDKYEEISDYIMHTIVRGISMYDIQGGYTHQKKTKIVTICSPRQVQQIKQFIAKIDMEAFIDVTSVETVWGKGVGFDRLADENVI